MAEKTEYTVQDIRNMADNLFEKGVGYLTSNGLQTYLIGMLREFADVKERCGLLKKGLVDEIVHGNDGRVPKNVIQGDVMIVDYIESGKGM